MNPIASNLNFLAVSNMQATQGKASTSEHMKARNENNSWQKNIKKCFETFLRMQQLKNQDDNSAVAMNMHKQGRLCKTLFNENNYECSMLC